MDEVEANLAQACRAISQRLQAVVSDTNAETEAKRARLQADMAIAKQGLELCNVARESSRQKVYRIGEIIADDNSDHVAANTSADLFEIQKAQSTGKSALLFGTFSDESLQVLAEQRYGTCFGAVRASVPIESTIGNVTKTRETPKCESSTHHSRRGEDDRHGIQPKQAKPTSNEMRRRVTDDTHE